MGRVGLVASLHPGVLSTLLGAVGGSEPTAGRHVRRNPAAFPDAGLDLLRTRRDEGPEIWCRCDGGPHGFLSIAAHAHADALSVEVRHDGVEVLVDPGTYCYHGEPEWRSYFRSTRAHNTLEIDGQDQAVEAGPFMWATHADAVVDRADLVGRVQDWRGHHTAYARLDPALRHDRQVLLDADDRRLTVVDSVTGTGAHTARLRWHLGPDVTVILTGSAAELRWCDRAGPQQARFELPGELTWSAHRGETDPPLGWFSPRFGVRVPSTTLVGVGEWSGSAHPADRPEVPLARPGERRRTRTRRRPPTDSSA